MATIYEVSRLAGVSLATVSRVINDSGRVSEKTRQKVLSAMQELDYRPNSIAQSLASNRSNCVGVLVSELHGPIFGAMLSSIETELRGAGKFALFAAGHSIEEKEKEGIQFLTSRNCDALILHVEALRNEFFAERADRLLPFVLLNRAVPELEQSCISLNNERGGFEAAQLLLQMGHRDIAYISGPLAWGDAQARLTGHKRALSELRIDFNEDLLVEGDYHEVGGSRAMQQLLRLGQPITAVACANDEMAAGAMDVIRQNGLSIPGDISVVGFDNVRWASYLSPKLTTVDYPVSEMSRMAARWVLRNVYGNERLKIQHVFHPKLVSRESVSQPPAEAASDPLASSPRRRPPEKSSP